MELGAAWYSLRTEDAQLRAGLTKAEGMITGSGTKAGTAGGQAIGKGLGAGATVGGAAIVSASTSTAGKITGIFGSATSKIGGFMKTSIGGAIGALGAAFAATKIIGFFGDAISAASDLGETTSKVSIVFGQAADEVFAMGKTSAEALGMSENAALSAAGTYGNLFRAMGITEQESAKMSIGLVNLASDLASFNNMDPTEVLDKLRAGLSGETEPLRALGVNLNAARIQAKAFEMGLASTTAGLTPAIKAQATYALILEDTTLAQGDFARTSDGLANQQRILAAEMENVSAELGQKLLPVMVELAHFAVDVLVPALRSTIDFLIHMAGEVTKPFDAIADRLRELDVYFGTAGKGLELTANQMGVDAGKMKDAFEEAVNEMGMSSEDALAYAKEVASGIPYHMTIGGLSATAAWKKADLGGTIASDLAGSGGRIRAGVQAGISEPTAEELAQVKEDAEAAARAMTADYAATIASGADTVTQAWDALLKGAESEMTETARIADIQAKLAAPALRDALNSEDPFLRAQAIATKGTLLEQLALLETGAISYAVRTGQALPDALENRREAARQTAMWTRMGVIREFDLGALSASGSGARTGASYGTGISSQTGFVLGRTVSMRIGAANSLGSGNAFNGGYSLVSTWLNGMQAAWAQRRATIDYIAAQAGYIFGRSLPRIGPLKGGLRSGGRSVGESWVDGLIESLNKAPGRIRQPISVIPRIAPVAFSGGIAQAAAAVGGGGNSATFGNINIGVHLPPGWEGNAADVTQLSRNLATQIRMRSSSAFK